MGRHGGERRASGQGPRRGASGRGGAGRRGGGAGGGRGTLGSASERRGASERRTARGRGAGASERRRAGDGRRPGSRRTRLVVAAVALAAVALLLVAFITGRPESGGGGYGSGEVRIVPVSGIVDFPTADFVTGNLDDAAAGRARAVVLVLDTAGGFFEPTQRIIRKMESLQVPVAAFVAPAGAAASGSGACLLLASDYAAMAPGTRLDSSLPAAMPGASADETAVAIRDWAGYVGALAGAAGRARPWSEVMASQPLSLSPQEALEHNIINSEAAGLEPLLKQMNGFNAAAKGVIIQTDGGAIEETGMGPVQKLRHFLGDPGRAYLLLTAGLLLLSVQLVRLRPGVLAAGAILTATGGYLLFRLTAGSTGIALTFAGFVLMGAAPLTRAKNASLAITGAGAAFMIAGSLLMFSGGVPFLDVSPVLVITVPAAAAAAIRLASGPARRPSRKPSRKRVKNNQVGHTAEVTKLP